MPELVYDVKFRIDTSNVETVKAQMQQATSAPSVAGGAGGGFNAAEAGAKGLTKELKELRTQTLTTAQEIGTLVNKLATASSGFTQFNDETERLESELKQLVSGGLQPGISAFEDLASKTELSATGQLNAERTVKSLTGTVRTAEGALRRYSDAQDKSAKSTALSTNSTQDQAKSFSSLISASTLQQGKLKDLSIQMVALANSGEGTEQQFEQLRTEFSSQLEIVDRYIKLLRNASQAEGLSIAQKAKLQATINSLSQTSVRANSAIGAMSQQNLAVGHSSQLANKQLAIGNQLFFSMSDGIQDAAQFSQGFSVGMRAVGNNIGFTAELMAAFIARTAVMNGGIVTMTAVMNSLKASFLGVGGVILALNTAITLITVFSQKSAQAEKEVSRLSEVMKQLREQSQLDFGINDQLEREADQIRQSITLLRDLDEKRRESRMIYVDPSADKSVLIRRREARKAVEEQAASVELLIESFGLEEKSIEALEAKLKEVTDAQRVFTDSMNDSQIAFGVLFDNIEEGVKRALLDQELGLTRASSAISYQRERVENLVRSWTILVELGDDSLIPMLKRAKDALDELTEEDDDEETNKVAKNYQLLTEIFLQERVKPTQAALLRLRDLELQLAEETIKDADELAFERLQIEAKYQDSLIDFNEKAFETQKKYFQDVIEEERKSALATQELEILKIEQREDTESKFSDLVKARMTLLEMSSEYELMSDAEKELARQKIILDSEKQITKFKEDEAKRRLQIEADAERAIQQVKAQGIQGVAALAQATSSTNEGIANALLAVEKALRIADVIVNAKAAIAKITAAGAVRSAALDPTAAASVAKNIALVKGSAAISIAAILAQGLSKGGGSVGGGGGAGGVSTQSPFGFQMNEVAGSQTFLAPGFMPSTGTGAMAPKVSVEILADRKKLYYIVKQGEEEYRQSQA